MSKFWKEIVGFLLIVIIFLLVIQTCENRAMEQSSTKIDTIYLPKNGVILTKPVITNSIPPTNKEVEIRYIPDKNYEKLVEQYKTLAKLFLTKNIECDSIPIDSLGYVKIVDTIKENSIKGRKFEYQFKIPVITKTTTIIPEKKREFFIGSEIQAREAYKFNQLSSKILYKTKKDKIFGLSVGLDDEVKINYGLSYYWKLN